MDRSSNLPSAASSVSVAPIAPSQVRAPRGPPASGREVSAGKREVDSAELTLRLAEDHDRIARGVNDVVVRRLFAAGLDLQSALGLMGEHRATPRICHAVGELDQAIRDLRDAIFGWDRDVADSRRPNR